MVLIEFRFDQGIAILPADKASFPNVLFVLPGDAHEVGNIICIADFLFMKYLSSL